MPPKIEGFENSHPITRQIPFHENGASEKLKSFKLTTIRMPSEKYEGFSPGDRIIGACDRMEIPLVVWGVLENVPISQIPQKLLLLDGYATLEEAIKDLRTYGGKYGGINVNTPMTLIAVISEERYNEFDQNAQNVLLSQREGKRLEDIMQDEQLSGFFEEVLDQQRQSSVNPTA